MQCTVAGGAAGLTLTVASAVFLMEPALNPGLEAQAAARIHRLGMRRRCGALRVKRMLACTHLDLHGLLTAGPQHPSALCETSVWFEAVVCPVLLRSLGMRA